MGEESKARDVVDAVTGLVTAVPVYQDVVQPAAKEIGKGLQTVAKSVHVALAPFSILIWGYEQVKEFVQTKVSERLANVPPENIVPPKPSVAGPALEALRFSGQEETLADMYANLLASAMDKETAHGAHPAFVEIIKQLTPDEAKIVSLFLQERPYPLLDVGWTHKPNAEGKSGGIVLLSNFSQLAMLANVEFPANTPTYIVNLCRLGLAEVPAIYEYTTAGLYDPLENAPEVLALKRAIEANPAIEVQIIRRGLRVTDFGKQFARVCVQQKNQVVMAGTLSK